MNILKKVWYWLVYSSQNPEKISLSLKAGSGALLWFLMVTGHQDAIDAAGLSAVTTALLHMSTQIVGIGLDLATIFGVARKLYFTFFPKQVG